MRVYPTLCVSLVPWRLAPASRFGRWHNGLMHQLDGAREHIYGAQEHLDMLRPEIQSFAQIVSKDVSLKYVKGFVTIKGQQREVPIGTASFPMNRPTPPRAARLIGEVVQNLRSALDYLVYELARFDSKSAVDKTQFVIADSEENFLSSKWHLRGLSGDHIAAIERLQPYRGCEWTKFIRDISNPDKHRHLTALKHPTVISIDSRNTERILAGQKAEVGDYASIQIAFSNGPPVIEGLEQLIADVAHTLDAFESEFK